MGLSNVRVGVAAERPAADPSNRGLIYVSSDTDEVTASDGAGWVATGPAVAPGENVAAGTQQADITSIPVVGGLTSSGSDEPLAPALTSVQITGGQDPTEAEYNQLQADVDALRTAFNDVATDHSLVQDDLASLRQTVVDVRVAVNATLAVLDEYEQTA